MSFVKSAMSSGFVKVTGVVLIENIEESKIGKYAVDGNIEGVFPSNGSYMVNVDGRKVFKCDLIIACEDGTRITVGAWGSSRGKRGVVDMVLNLTEQEFSAASENEDSDKQLNELFDSLLNDVRKGTFNIKVTESKGTASACEVTCTLVVFKTGSSSGAVGDTDRGSRVDAASGSSAAGLCASPVAATVAVCAPAALAVCAPAALASPEGTAHVPRGARAPSSIKIKAIPSKRKAQDANPGE